MSDTALKHRLEALRQEAIRESDDQLRAACFLILKHLER